jgi:hypothetical protein
MAQRIAPPLAPFSKPKTWAPPFKPVLSRESHQLQWVLPLGAVEVQPSLFICQLLVFQIPIIPISVLVIKPGPGTC